MNTNDYIVEGLWQLEDPNFYAEQPTDLTPTHWDSVCTVIDAMAADHEISEKCRDYILENKPRMARFYMLPKIHKGKFPPLGRPIISGNNCPTERISQLVDHFLKEASPLGKSFLRDTTDFIQQLEKIGKAPPGSLLVTLDVSSLYTNIPNQEGLDAAAEALETTRPNAKGPSNQALLRLLNMVLRNNNFSFCGKHYLQVGGTAMGTKVAPNFAVNFMHAF